MAIIDLITSTDPPQTVYLFRTPGAADVTAAASSKHMWTQGEEVLHFQYWPQSVQDDYQVEYAEHFIPGGSHPLYQWVGGRGRTITFQALFTSELDENRIASLTTAGGSTVGDWTGQSALTPSAQYTVNIDAALSRLRGWMRPEYKAGGRLGDTDPPPILTLAMRGTMLAGATDMIQVILRSAPITYESWFPNGRPRIASVDIQLTEVVQWPSEGGNAGAAKGSVRFLDRRVFNDASKNYKFRGLGDRPYLGGGL